LGVSAGNRISGIVFTENELQAALDQFFDIERAPVPYFLEDRTPGLRALTAYILDREAEGLDWTLTEDRLPMIWDDLRGAVAASTIKPIFTRRPVDSSIDAILRQENAEGRQAVTALVRFLVATCARIRGAWTGPSLVVDLYDVYADPGYELARIAAFVNRSPTQQALDLIRPESEIL
jgi:hypothetical protein